MAVQHTVIAVIGIVITKEPKCCHWHLFWDPKNTRFTCFYCAFVPVDQANHTPEPLFHIILGLSYFFLVYRIKRTQFTFTTLLVTASMQFCVFQFLFSHSVSWTHTITKRMQKEHILRWRPVNGLNHWSKRCFSNAKRSIDLFCR